MILRVDRVKGPDRSAPRTDLTGEDPLLDAWIDPRNGPDFDLPPVAAPVPTYVIASVPRSGSTLLARSLWDTGLVGAPKEYLNPMQVRDWEVRLGAAPWGPLHRVLRGRAVGLAGRGVWSDARLADHLRRVRARRTGPHGFGLKVHHHHFRRWFLDAGRDPVTWLGATHWVRVTRAHRVAQAVSWARALRTDRWVAHDRASVPRLSRVEIAARLAAIEAQEVGWDAWFDARGITPLTVTYAELVGDRVATVRRVLGHLGVPDAHRVAVPPAPLSRQADAASVAWAAAMADARGA